ncbi:hypothetical protein STVIR_7042 [Streptomyces viridochromogenes Tue57]|uniref:Uncharacterized protein n=1 Tax=Streptomyces viridochromogenes Tue57 TaxID=1160705 RepID=L8P694_STRVR|nr:hypothetical protein STVIR_7042 [Streptomyces viridochromogenes Tue57]
MLRQPGRELFVRSEGRRRTPSSMPKAWRSASTSPGLA